MYLSDIFNSEIYIKARFWSFMEIYSILEEISFLIFWYFLLQSWNSLKTKEPKILSLKSPCKLQAVNCKQHILEKAMEITDNTLLVVSLFKLFLLKRVYVLKEIVRLTSVATLYQWYESDVNYTEAFIS